jgi:hypothetical protein
MRKAAYSQPGRKFLDETFIAIRLRSSQLMIQMCHGDFIVEIPKDEQQSCGVRAP